MRPVVVWSLAAIGTAAVGFFVLQRADHVGSPQQAPVPSHARQEVADLAPRPGEAGMRVSIDPETGELGLPSPQQQKAEELELREALSRSTEGLQREVLPDGTVKVNLQGRFQNASVAVIDAEGNLRTGCVENHAGAQAALHGGHCGHTTPEEK